MSLHPTHHPSLSPLPVLPPPMPGAGVSSQSRRAEQSEMDSPVHQSRQFSLSPVSQSLPMSFLSSSWRSPFLWPDSQHKFFNHALIVPPGYPEEALLPPLCVPQVLATLQYLCPPSCPHPTILTAWYPATVLDARLVFLYIPLPYMKKSV